MADSKDPIEVPLSELQKLRMEAAETQAKLVKERVVAEVQKKYAVLLALEVKQALDSSVQVRIAELRVNAAANQTLEELKGVLPEGYAPTVISWEAGKAEAVYNPEQAKQRLPEEVEGKTGDLPGEPQVPQDDAPPVE